MNRQARRAYRWITMGLLALSAALALAAMGEGSFARFDETGRLLKPDGYREWVFIGAPITPNDMNDGKAAFPEFHHVYIDPRSWSAYQATGEYPEGTMIVKELLSVGTKLAASGNGYFAGEFIGLEATVKSRRLFPDEPGNWAYFTFTNEEGGPPRKAAEVMPVAACNGCHAASAEKDWVFSQHYPVLDRPAR